MALQWPLGPAMNATLGAVQDRAGHVGPTRPGFGAPLLWLLGAFGQVT